MLSGLMLILIGILIYLHPHIIVTLGAGFLVFSGVMIVLTSLRLRRMYRAGRQADNAWTRFMIRF